MARERQRAEWSRTASLLALLASVHRDPKKRRRPYSAAEWNPYATDEDRLAAEDVETDTNSGLALLGTFLHGVAAGRQTRKEKGDGADG
ncbi:MAG: hypothetical protein HRF50_04510 [Phycisphaerae bacterium]